MNNIRNRLTKNNAHGIKQYKLIIPMYESCVNIVFGQEKKLESFFNVKTRGHSGMVFDVSNGCLVWFHDNGFEMVSGGVLSHEIVHVVDSIRNFHGIKHFDDSNNNEHIAYLTGYLFETLLTLFKKK